MARALSWLPTQGLTQKREIPLQVPMKALLTLQVPCPPVIALYTIHHEVSLS